MGVGGGKEVSTASRNWSKVLMGEWSHPPCEGWRGNVAGGNGFSQSAETGGGGGSLGATAAPRTVRLPAGTQRCVCLPARRAAPAFDSYFGPFFPGRIDGGAPACG